MKDYEVVEIKEDYNKNEIEKIINNFEIEINNYSKNEVEKIIDKIIEITSRFAPC